MSPVQVTRSRPWHPDSARFAQQGSVTLRLREGDDPPEIAQRLDVLVGAQEAASRIDGGGRIDRALSRYAGAMRVTRLFNAARNVRTEGARHRGYDDVEREIGLSRTFRVDFDPNASVHAVTAALADLEAVEMASPCYLSATPFATPSRGSNGKDVSQPRGWAHERIGAREALAMEPGDTTLIVAIIDSGVALDHPELRGHLRPGVDLVDLDAASIAPRGLKLFGDLRGRDRRPMDDVGHGTACASLIGGGGIEMEPGIGGASPMLAIRVLAAAQTVGSDEMTAIGAAPDIDLGVKTAIDLGARVLNLSFGTPESALRDDDPVPHTEIVRYAMARDCVLVAASGNMGERIRYFPAALPGVIAVGAIGRNGAPSGFCSRGDHVLLCAPGESVWAASRGGYRAHDGTSFAAPLVSGACALLLARGARFGTPLSAFDVRGLLERSARAFGPGIDADGCGAGVLDVPAALRAADALLHGDVAKGASDDEAWVDVTTLRAAEIASAKIRSSGGPTPVDAGQRAR